MAAPPASALLRLRCQLRPPPARSSQRWGVKLAGCCGFFCGAGALYGQVFQHSASHPSPQVDSEEEAEEAPQRPSQRAASQRRAAAAATAAVQQQQRQELDDSEEEEERQVGGRGSGF